MITEATVGAALALAGVWVKSRYTAIVATKRADVEAVKEATRDDRHEREITERVAIAEREDRRSMESEIRDLRERVTHLSVDLARCEERHRLSEERLGDLETKLNLAMQLIDRQKTQIDNLVRAALDRDSVRPEAP